MIWALAFGCPHVGAPQGAAMACTVTVAAGESASKAVQPGAVVCLAPGVHPGALFIGEPGTYEIRGEPGAIVDAGGKGAALRVSTDDATVHVVGVEFRGGHAELGGGARVDGYATVVLEDCAFAGSRGAQGGVAGLGVSAGTVTARRVRFAEDVLFTGTGEVTLDDCDVTGELRAREGAQVIVHGGVVGALDVRGTTTRAPSVRFDGAQLLGAVHNDDAYPGDVTGVGP